MAALGCRCPVGRVGRRCRSTKWRRIGLLAADISRVVYAPDRVLNLVT